MDVLSVADNNSRTFLTAVLQCKKPPVRIKCYIVLVGIDTEYTAFFMQLIRFVEKVPHSSSLMTIN